MRFNTKPSVFLSGDSVMISFSLSWDHAWRDDFNWDAVWVFGKYTVGMEDSWHHLNLLPSGHIMPPDFTYDVGNIDASRAGGVFLMLADQGGSNVYNQTFTIKTMRSDFGNIADTSIANNDIFLSLSAVEMVYIPYGGYYLGDGATANRIGDSGGNPIAVNSEDALNVSTFENGSEGEAKSLPATFPKGYKGFYCMKYEVSQEQYVGFLNNLTRDQQKERIGNDLDELKVGEYVFGDKSHPSYRNGICVLSNPAGGQPAVFGCNLNPAEPYFGEDDGKCIACNYLTYSDMLAYCDYACLRPMSELEYEKSCRRPYPQAALAGEFVWNSASGVNGLNAKRDLLNVGKVSEKPSSSVTNVNYDNSDFGPVRCAAFGTSSSTQTQAGATFWGLMEMSGNVAELCYSVDAGSNFNTSDIYASHGNGEIADAVAAWATTPASFIAKGGDFTSFQNAELMISDRTRANVSDVRDSTIGFRAVHTFGSSSGVVNPGIIKVAAINCPGEEITVSDSVQASAMWNGVAMYTKISYVWYVKEGAAGAWSLIPNEVGADLQSYKPLTPVSGAGLSVKFKRKAVSSLGEAESAEISTIVPNMSIIFTPASSKLDACGPGIVMASIAYTAIPTFTWTTETGTKTGASYTPEYTDFNAGTSASGDISVTCLAEWSGCSNTDTLTVAVTAPISFTCGTQFTDTRDSKVYPTVKIGSQCWMAANMNIGTRVASSNSTTHQTAGIQKICYNNSEGNCTTYGGLYNWDETVNGEKSGSIKYVCGSSTVIQGICPDGWHVPSDAEFKTLEKQLGMTEAQANAEGWRGTDQGTKLKSTSSLWTSGTTTNSNSSGWSALPGGYKESGGVTRHYDTSDGYWWSSSVNNSGYACRRILYGSSAAVYRNFYYKPEGFSVRCLLN